MARRQFSQNLRNCSAYLGTSEFLRRTSAQVAFFPQFESEITLTISSPTHHQLNLLPQELKPSSFFFGELRSRGHAFFFFLHFNHGKSSTVGLMFSIQFMHQYTRTVSVGGCDNPNKLFPSNLETEQ